jgi:hypothetical protein
MIPKTWTRRVERRPPQVYMSEPASVRIILRKPVASDYLELFLASHSVHEFRL